MVLCISLKMLGTKKFTEKYYKSIFELKLYTMINKMLNIFGHQELAFQQLHDRLLLYKIGD